MTTLFKRNDANAFVKTCSGSNTSEACVYQKHMPKQMKKGNPPKKRRGLCRVRHVIMLSVALNVVWFRRIPEELGTRTQGTPQGTSTRATNTTGVDRKSSQDKLERIKLYSDIYKYQTPDATRPAAVSANVSCGSSPAFRDYFKKRTRKFRSQFNEDKWLWANFFSNFEELLNPPSKAISHRRQPPPTFVELGAFNGLVWSNTIFFEACLGWTNGLMIEASPSVFPELVINRPATHRLSFAPSCKTRSNLTFGANGMPGTSVVQDDGSNTTTQATVKVPCGPLGPVLEDLLDGYVTFFSLDVEGSEAAVLETIDFSRVRVDIWMVESERSGPDKAATTKAAERVVEILTSNGYRLYRGLLRNSNLFVHKDSPYQLDAVKYKSAQ
jgi:hypothetical protein